MKKLFRVSSPLVFVLALFFSLSSQAQQKDPTTILTEQNYRVLSGRVHKILEYRLKSPNTCSPAAQKAMLNAFHALPEYSDQKAVVISTLQLYLDTYKVDPACKKSLDAGERQFYKLERARFWPLRKTINTVCPLKKGQSAAMPEHECYLKIQEVAADLEPHCVSMQVPNIDGSENDPLPCMVGDYLAGKELVSDKNWKSFLFSSRAFLNKFRNYLNDPKVKAINLYQVYRADRQDTPELREEFLAYMNLNFSSSISGSSYIRGFHDHIWAYLLFKDMDPDYVLSYFVMSRLIVDEFRAYLKLASTNKKSLIVNQFAMKAKNRHDYMAAFLACHYRDRPKSVRERLPIMLGYTYESLDFVTHIQAKVPLKASVENFTSDTNRYRTGVNWGERFCNMQP